MTRFVTRGLVGVFLAMPAAVHAQVEDLTPPTIASVTFSPDTINAGAGAQNVTVTQHLTDDLAGVSFSCFGFMSPSSQQIRSGCTSEPGNRESGTSLDGIYKTEVTFPQFSETGEWRLFYLYVCDLVGNCRYSSPEELAAFPTVQVVATPDSTPPTVASIEVNPNSIDVSTGGQVVTVMQHLTDDSAGVSFSCFGLFGPSAQQIRSGCTSDPQSRDSGNNLDGFYHAGIFFPQFSEAGDWHFFYLYVCDVVGNCRYYSQEELAAFPTVQVVSTPDDTTPPGIATFAFSPATIDTSASAQNVTMTQRLTDDLSGVSFSCFGLLSPIAQQIRSGCTSDPHSRDSGNNLDGTYHTDIVFPQFSETGEWHVFYLYVCDAVGNCRYSSQEELAALPSVLVLEADTTAPTLNISLSADTLWPPNHRLVAISASIEVSDDSDPHPTIEIVSITSNEPDNGLGDGDMPNDIQDATLGSDDRAFSLRAERSGAGEGRHYTVTYRATDASGNTTTAVAAVTVPQAAAGGDPDQHREGGR